MKVYSARDYPQGSDLWWELRKGRITASGMDRILTAKTRKPSTQQEGYIAELIGDLTCLCPTYFTSQGRPVNKYMEFGKNTEAEARRFYELETGQTVTEVGMCTTDDDRFSCSPDGLVNPDGGLEVKCPMQKTHAEYLIKEEVPTEYIQQVHGSLIVTGRKWWDFLSYAPGLPPMLIRVYPDEFTEALRKELESFWVKFEALKRKLGVGPLGQPEESKDSAGVKIWRDQLSTRPECDLLNTWLPEMADLPIEEKRIVWSLIKGYAADRGWEFVSESKRFVETVAA